MRIKIPEAAVPVMAAIERAGGRPFLVGGAVRDAVLGLPPKDSDVEAHGIDFDPLVGALLRVGPVNAVGVSFGVLKVDVPGLGQVDVSLPRRDSKVGPGHTGTLSDFDPTLTVEEAASRRDFTINAMMANVHGVVTDPFNGLNDLRLGCLRAVDARTFPDDPLRVLRAVQFASRFNLWLDPVTADLCRGLFFEFQTLSRERVWEELSKWARGRHPGAGLRVLEQTWWLSAFPLLDALRGTPQDPRFHPEGNAWEHTVQAVEAAGTGGFGEVVVWAALLHDVGKPATTEFRDDRITSHGHAELGAELASAFMRSLVHGAPNRRELVNAVPALVGDHMVHAGGPPTPRAVRRLSLRLARSGATVTQLAKLAEADASGRHPAPPDRPMERWLEMAERLTVSSGGPMPLVQGRDLIHMGLEPGPAFGGILSSALEAQVEGEFNDAHGAEAWVRSHVIGPWTDLTAAVL